MKPERGFSLVELLIVVVIIGIVAAIAIPNLLAARRASYEGSAVSSLRTYHSAQATYASTYGNGNYAGEPFVTNAFETLSQVSIIDSTLGTGQKNGYVFAGHSAPKTATTTACHLAQAYPSVTSGFAQTGTRIFVIATEGVVFEGEYTGSAGWGPGTCEINPALIPLRN